MAQVEYNLPGEFKARQNDFCGVYRPGVNVTKAASGYMLARVWSEMNLRRYQMRPEMMPQSGDGLKNLKSLLNSTTMGTSAFWLKEQVVGTHLGVPCGPLGDASRTCFPVPFYGSITDGLYMIDDAPQSASDYTIHETANLLKSDNFSNPSSATGWSAANATESIQNNFGLLGPSCLLITPDTVGATLVEASTPSDCADVTVGDTYTMIVAVYETMSSPRTFTYGLRWYTSGDAYISTNTTATAASQGWNIFSYSAVAPATAAHVTPEVGEPGATVDQWFADALAVCPGTYDRVHLPSMAPNMIELDSAPSLNERITASGDGVGMARVVFEKSVVNWAMRSPGHATPSRIVALEQVEV